MIGECQRGNIKKTLNESYREKIDYKITNNKSINAGRPRETIYLTPDCFKRISMLTKSSKGEEVRSYYIQLEKHIDKIFWPSSIAVFGPTTPMDQTPQHTIMEPTTVYGISKQAGERWCEYYNLKFGVDVRSIRYPGLISYKSLPGGGTTDYAVDIFYKAKENKKFNCFLKEDTALPMMFMDDAIRATIELMEAPIENVKIKSSYNLAGISFTPKVLAKAIQKAIPNFEIEYNPDFRQAIADSWPNSIDDSMSKKHWGWEPKFDLDGMVQVMLENL